ncbi:uncharacterized protein LOC111406256 [Olea europaea var. sylvestris]|uniref:uncharacterized protein LOC111406256 n=1 Tax=Olea europaea var. sylvestris TaxID=158386 RepID=UPI000C1D7C40|nr:uncharacterized protein LOC111406256 [Olea europaea var. sylvestris]
MRWFFIKLREVIGKVEDLAFVTDRGQSIINGIAEVFPDTHHGYCMYHIQGNLKPRYRGKDIVSLFRRVTEAYSIEECNMYMVEIGSKSFPVWDYLKKMGIEHWACSYFLGRRYNMITSNNVESLNALFKRDRELIILALIDNICTKLQQWFHDRRVQSYNCTSVLALAQEVKLFKAGRKLNVDPLDESRFSVEFTVAMYRGFAARILCSPYYTAENWRAVYVETIFSLPNEFEWEVPDHICPFNILSPPLIEPRGPGRPSIFRIPSTEEFSRPCRCSRCKSVGHTRQFCTNQVPLNDS